MSEKSNLSEFQEISRNSKLINSLKSDIVLAKKSYEELRASKIKSMDPKKIAIDDQLSEVFKKFGYYSILADKTLAQQYYKSHQVGEYPKTKFLISELFSKDFPGFSFSQNRVTVHDSSGDRIIQIKNALSFDGSRKLSPGDLRKLSETLDLIFETIGSSLGRDSLNGSSLEVNGNFLKRVEGAWEFVESESSSVWGISNLIESKTSVDSLFDCLKIAVSVK